MFANCSEEEEIYPLTSPEIAEAQKADSKLKHCFRRNAVIDKGLEVRLVDDTYVVCKDWKNDNFKATPKEHSIMVSLLLAARRTHLT